LADESCNAYTDEIGPLWRNRARTNSVRRNKFVPWNRKKDL